MMKQPLNWSKLLSNGLVVACIIIVYARTLGHDLVWDDTILLQTITGQGFPGFLRAEFLYAGSGYYRPLILLSLWIDRILGGGAPWLFHLTNLLLHSVNGVLLLHLLTRLSSPGVALWGSLFYVLHPVAVEPVAFVSGRTDLWAALIVLLLTTTWLRLRELPAVPAASWAMWGGLLLFGGLAKEVVLVLPGILLAWDAVLPASPRTINSGWNTRSRGLLLAAGGAIGFLFLLRWTIAGIGFGFGVVQTVSDKQVAAVTSLALIPQILASYVGLLFWPWPLNSRHTVDQLLGGPAAIAMVALLAALCAFTARRRFGRAGLLGLIWMLGFLFPVIGLVKIGGAVIAERFLYLPSIGLALVVGVFLDRTFADHAAARRAASAVAIGVLSTCAVLSYRQTGVWRNEVTLFEHNVRSSPTSLLAKSELSSVYHRVGRDAEAYRLRGDIQSALGFFGEAVTAYSAMLRSPGGDTPAGRAALGKALFRAGRFTDAMSVLLPLVKDQISDATGLEFLVRSSVQVGNAALAKEALQRLQTLNPQHADRLLSRRP